MERMAASCSIPVPYKQMVEEYAHLFPHFECNIDDELYFIKQLPEDLRDSLLTAVE